MQLNFNNEINAIIEKSSNELTFNFQLKKIITIVVRKTFITLFAANYFVNNKFMYKQKTANAIFFVTIKFKILYNNKYQLLRFRFNEKTYFRLHQNFFFFFKSNYKLFNQKTNFFVIKRKIKKLTYEFELFSK